MPVGHVRHLLGRAGLTEATTKSLAAVLAPVLNAHTNLRLLDDALQRARAADDTDDPEPATIIAAVKELSGLDPKELTGKGGEEG